MRLHLPLIMLTAIGCGGAAAPIVDTHTPRPTTIDSYPSISPDNGTLVFQSNRSGHWEIYARNADGTNERQLTSGPGRKIMPNFSPDGTKIVYVVTPTGNLNDTDVWVMNTDGSGAQRL